MASIYRGATLTISMTSARNSHEGSGITHPLPPATQFNTFNGSKSFFALRNVYQVHLQGHELYPILSNAPIHDRAWILQEKVLSRRILHATKSQFAWQCATQFESEDGIVHRFSLRGHPFNTLDCHLLEIHVKTSAEDIRRRWWSWVGEYRSRSLTNIDDQYAAFAGVTRLYQEMTSDQPILGMWKKNLAIHLAWSILGPPLRTPLKQARSPSWSWMTLPLGTFSPSNIWRFEFNNFVKMKWERERSTLLPAHLHYEAELIDYDVQWKGAPLVSTASSGTLRMRGRLDRVALNRIKGSKIDENKTEFDPYYLDKDYALEKYTDRLFDMFVLFAYEQESSFGNTQELSMACLILEACDGEVQYRRIGIIERSVNRLEGISVEDSLPGTYQTITLV
ncbi:hypothetical protein N0V90_009100 [Kalmusia sp. IMI 367209]|nr:hypothetical protein N0V90_009100 [Kalmusia sp. IMI 367209]